MDNRPIVLVVDDEATQRATLFDQLDQRGYRVLLAEDGETAVEITKNIRPNAILLDVVLPGIDGYETCRQIKVHGQNTDIPILFMTGLDDGPTRNAIYKAGGNAHLIKPPIPIEVTSLIDQFIELQQFRNDRRSSQHGKSAESKELERYIDYVAHDMKSPLLSILGFAEELLDEFSEANPPEEWKEYTELIHKSSASVDGMLDALVLLKNIPKFGKPQSAEIDLSKIIESALSRYRDLPSTLKINEKTDLHFDKVHGDPTLVEELYFVLLRIISQLNPETDSISLQFTSETAISGEILATVEAETREISDSEVKHIFEPLTAEGRKKVSGTDALSICAQKIIELLRIDFRAKRTETGLKIQLIFHSAH